MNSGDRESRLLTRRLRNGGELRIHTSRRMQSSGTRMALLWVQPALPINCSLTTGQCFTCLKKIFPAIFLPHLHVLTTRACFWARETGRLLLFEMPYSSLSHLAVAGSIKDMLIWSPCFLQNSSNDLSVTNESSTFSLPLQMNFCSCSTASPSRSAARSHGYASTFDSIAVILTNAE